MKNLFNLSHNSIRNYQKSDNAELKRMSKHFYLMLLISFFAFFILLLPKVILAQEIESTGTINMSRPDPGGVPTNVSVGSVIINIESVSGSEQSYTAKFALIIRWKDSRLACKPGEGPDLIRKFKINQVWHPQILLVNKRSLSKMEEEVVLVDCKGGVEYFQVYYGDLLTISDIKDFPFDTRPLRIDIVSKAYSPEEVLFSLDEEFSGRADEFSIVDWYIGSEPTTEATEYLLKSRVDRQVPHSRFIIEYNADRNSGYYIWKVIFPMFLIVFMSFAVFWIPSSEMATQVGLSVTSMLTLIAYRFAIGSIIPNVDYLTRFDKFVFGSTLLIFMALVVSVTTGSLSVKGRVELAERIDLYSRFVFPSAFIIIVIYSFLV
jgi:gamma-aminobutyric acid receptor subunit beta